MSDSPFLRFIGQRIDGPTPPDTVVVEPAPGAPRYRLSDDEYRLAQLFDGQSDRQARIRAAGGSAHADNLDRLALELTEAGLLEAGKQEPLPVPPQYSTGGLPPGGGGEGHPPAATPGSLAGPGLPGHFGAATSSHRGGETSGIPVSVGPLLAIGRALNVFTAYQPLRWLLWALGIVVVVALWHLRAEATEHVVQLLAPYRLLLIGLPTAVLINVLSTLSRAAAIESWTPEGAPIRLQFALGFIPRLQVDTEGPVERADLSARLHILGAGLQTTMLMFVAGGLGWLMLRQTGDALPSLLLAFTILAAISTLLRANPLAPREGYRLLAHRLGAPDLRDQAWMALFGWQRPWARSAPPPKGALWVFAIAVIAYIITVLTLIIVFPARWLGAVWGGIGFGLVLGALLLAAVLQIRKIGKPRQPLAGTWGHKNREWPSRRFWGWLGLAAVIALLPYRYDAGGRLTVLPAERAEVRALVPGDIREVFVSEGDVVDSGQELARLYDAREAAQVATSEAQVRRLEAQLALERAGATDEEIELARQRIVTARARHEFAKGEAERAETAYRRRGISAQEYDRAISNELVQREELQEAKAHLEVITSEMRGERVDVLEAELEAERARLEYHRQQLEDMRLRAPIAGRVISDRLQHARGRYLDAGDWLASIELQDRMLAELRVPESQIGIVREGAHGRVRVWAHPERALTARVEAIAPNAEESDHGGNIVRVVLSVEDPRGLLRAEMTGRGKVEGQRLPVIVVFTRALVRFVLVEVWSWLP